MSHLLNRETRTTTASFSLNHNGADDIKKGLQRIKQAQIQVLRELRKDDPEASKNYSLTYSKETTLDSKPTLKIEGEVGVLKHKIEKLQHELSDSIAKQGKLRKQCLQLAQQAKRSKQQCVKAEIKMKQYEKGEERALAKAQEGLSNAIISEKKYIALKSEYDKISKERERLSNELKRIQKKQLADLINNHESQSHIPNKIIKQLALAQQSFHEIIRDINNHKCAIKKEKQVSASSNSKNQQPVVQSVNAFTISTFETQQKLDKNINNVILYLNSLLNLAPILYESNNYMSGSFRDDIRKIEEELDTASKGKNQKVIELQNINQQLSKKIAKLEGDVRELEEENGVLKNRLKQLAIELEDVKISKSVLEDQYDNFKIKTKEKEKLKEEEFQQYKQRNRQTKTDRETGHSKNRATSNNPQSPQPLHQKISKLEQQIAHLTTKLSSSAQHEQSLKQVIQKLQSQLESTNAQNRVSENQQKHELNKLNIQMQTETSFNKRNNQEWEEMVRAMSRMQEERLEYETRDRQMRELMDNEGRKYRGQIEGMEQELNQLRQHIEDARRESIAVSFDQTDLARLRNRENATRESNIVNKTVDELWSKKEGEYNNVNSLLDQIKPVQQSPSQPQLQPQIHPQLQPQMQPQIQPQIYQQQVPQNYYQQYRSVPSNQVSLVQIHQLNQYSQQYQQPQVQYQPVQYPQQQQFVQVQYPAGYYGGFGGQPGYFVR